MALKILAAVAAGSLLAVAASAAEARDAYDDIFFVRPHASAAAQGSGASNKPQPRRQCGLGRYITAPRGYVHRVSILWSALSALVKHAAGAGGRET